MTPLLISCVTALAGGLIADPIVESFAFFGCNRIEASDWDPASNPSSANLAQLKQTFRDIEGGNSIPRFVFVGGDLVLGYADDEGETVRGQLDAWGRLVREDPLFQRTRIVPFPGNHELDKKVGKTRFTNPGTIKVWNDWYGKSGFRQMARNGPRQGTDDADSVYGDQSTLSYSFDSGPVHYLILNTDTVLRTRDAPQPTPKVALIPIEWAIRDLDRAQANPRIRAVFVMGHRNLTTPLSSAGDSPIEPTQGQRLLHAIRSHPKVRAYVCAHVHAWDVSEIGGVSRAYQVVAGNGGSQLEEDWHPPGGTTFGFALFEVHESGRIVLNRCYRPTPPSPQKYFESSPVSPAPAQRESIVLYDPVK